MNNNSVIRNNNLKKKLLTFLKFFIGWPISIISIFFLVKLFLPNLNQIIGKIQNPNILLILSGIICFVTFYFLRSFLWKMLLKEKGYNIPLKKASFLWGLSELKRFIPGNIWSYLGKGIAFSQKGVGEKIILESLLFEAEFFILSCTIVSIFAVSFLLESVFLIKYYSLFLIPVIAVIVFAVSAIFIFNKRLIKKPAKTFFSFLANTLPDLSPYANFKLLLISILSLIFFGLGTYLTIVSVVFLNLSSILWFIGFFVFSLFLGYISFITPMGLGVREGVIIIGLSRMLTLQMAGFVAIYSRIILIISELIFLVMTFIWKTARNKLFLRIESFIKKHPHEIILGFLIVLYVIYFTVASFQRYDNFYSGRFDLGNMDQAVWNTIHGRIFKVTDPNGTNIISRLAFHADFILVLLAPLYFIWSNPKMLLLVQSIILGIAAVFVFLQSSDLLKNKNLSFSLSLAFLMSPSIQFSNLYDFHPVVLATTFLLATFYFLKQKKYFWFLFFLVLSALTKEQIWIIAGLLGLYAFSIERKKILGITIAAISFITFYYLVWHAIPDALGGKHFALSYYSDFGDSPTIIIKNIIFSPQKTLFAILQEKQLLYLLNISLPLGFLPLLNPLTLIFAAPDLLINLLSKNEQLHEIYYQYSSSITPFLFISTIYSIKNLIKLFPKIHINIYIFYIVFFAFLSAGIFGPLPGSLKPNINMFISPQPDREIINNFISTIPQKFSIASTNNLGSHLSHRQKNFTIPVGIDQADIILFLLNDPFAQPSLKAQKQFAKQMENDKNYIQVFRKNDFIVFEKRSHYLESGRKKIHQVKLFPLSIPTLANREYEGGAVNIEKKINSSKSFTSYIISYPSDGLKIYGLMNIPNSKKPENGFPVVIINHGYINPKDYSTIGSYKAITDYFSSRGFLVIKPDYRGNANSEIDDTALMRFAYPIDVMNLIVSIKSIGNADANSIYLWGHSMGGEVTLEVLEIIGKDPDLSKGIKAAVLWSPVIDPIRWFSKSHVPQLPEARITPFPYAKTFQILGTPDQNPTLWQSLSPLSYLSDINTPLQINQGTSDKTVPYLWSIELYNDLKSLNKNVESNLYPNNDHNITESWSSAAGNSLKFFRNN